MDGGLEWATVRGHVEAGLAEAGLQLELEAEVPDPETWGLSPAAVEAQERLLRMGGAAGGT